MGSAIAQSLSMCFGTYIEIFFDQWLKKTMRRLFDHNNEWKSFYSLFASMRYIDDKGIIIPSIVGPVTHRTLVLRTEIEGIQTFTESIPNETVKSFNRLTNHEKVTVLVPLFMKAADSNFYKTRGSTCILKNTTGEPFCGLRIIDRDGRISFEPGEYVEKVVKLPPCESYIRNSQKIGFVIGTLHRAYQYTYRDRWKENGIDIILTYIEAIMEQGYKYRILRRVIDRIPFLTREEMSLIKDKIWKYEKFRKRMTST